jgi:hypothetical protein
MELFVIVEFVPLVLFAEVEFVPIPWDMFAHSS